MFWTLANLWTEQWQTVLTIIAIQHVTVAACSHSQTASGPASHVGFLKGITRKYYSQILQRVPQQRLFATIRTGLTRIQVVYFYNIYNTGLFTNNYKPHLEVTESSNHTNNNNHYSKPLQLTWKSMAPRSMITGTPLWYLTVEGKLNTTHGPMTPLTWGVAARTQLCASPDAWIYGAYCLCTGGAQQ